MRIAVLIITVLLSGYILIGCSEDSTDSIDAYFYADNEEPHDNSVSMQSGDRSGRDIFVRIEATEIDVATVSSIVFDLYFCPETYEYISFREGDYLEAGGNVTYSIDSPPGSGIVHVRVEGLSPFEGVNGTGTFMVFHFEGSKEGVDEVCPFTFKNNGLYDNSEPPAFITGISWFAGKANVID